jgi:membrane fusion protein
MARQLFRQEAVDAQRDRFLGELTAARPLPLWAFTIAAVVIACAVIAIAVWGQYTRRERVTGYLASVAGAVPLLISEPGQVTAIDAVEGAEVKAGDPIAEVTIDRTLSSAAESSTKVLAELQQRQAMLAEEVAQTKALGDEQTRQSRQRETNLKIEIADADAEIALQKRRLDSVKETAKRYENLTNQHYVSDVALQQRRDEVTDQEIKLQALVRERAGLERDLSQAQLEQPSTALKTQTAIDQLRRQISELRQSSAEETVLGKTVIRSPVAGTVTNIAVARGQVVGANAPLATILPRDSDLHAELLVPTRAIGFIHPGQDVQLRYEAFPYERFGQYRGVIESVGSSAWVAGEHLGPLTLSEPVYRIVVKLDRQTVSANGQELALRSGMLVGADLLMERRTLLEWLFQPLLQLKMRMTR